MDILTEINWSLFTPEEKEMILKAVDNGDLDHITCLPGIKLTPDKEKEIEKIVLDLREIDLGDESKVREEMDIFWAKKGMIDTPEKEKEWQEKIDKENEEKKKEVEKEKDKINGETNNK